MYIHSVAIRRIRSISHLNLVFEPAEYAGWHVLLGDNGAGKSTVVRSIALSLAGPREAAALRQNWNDWLQAKQSSGFISLNVDPEPKVDKATGQGAQVTSKYILASLKFARGEDGAVSITSGKSTAKRYLWGTGKGWFCTSYGPFRRFSGGDTNLSKLFYSNPRLAPHLSAFGEDVALTECLEWLQTLHVKKLEGSSSDADVLDSLTTFLNEGGLLPHHSKLTEVSSNGVVFRDGNGFHVPVTLLSDGYRSILSMAFELIRQMTRVYGAAKVFESIRHGEMVINLPGVVLVDEIDAHLHPTWQRRIGTWFLKYFPRIQFIVTTHSPLVCQAAERGSVWKLPTPGTKANIERVKGEELNKLLYGDLVEAYDTELFGIASTRSESGKSKQSRLAQLNVRARHGKLSASERTELQKLRAMMPNSSLSTQSE